MHTSSRVLRGWKKVQCNAADPVTCNNVFTAHVAQLELQRHAPRPDEERCTFSLSRASLMGRVVREMGATGWGVPSAMAGVCGEGAIERGRGVPDDVDRDVVGVGEERQTDGGGDAPRAAEVCSDIAGLGLGTCKPREQGSRKFASERDFFRAASAAVVSCSVRPWQPQRGVTREHNMAPAKPVSALLPQSPGPAANTL